MLHRPHFFRSEDGVGVLTKVSIRTAAETVCVDLDGTLVCTDTLWESLLLLAKARPWHLLLAVAWLCRGKAYLKRQIASRVAPNAALLPYRPEVVESLRDLKRAGGTVYLTTAADQRIADDVANHLGLFDAVVASDGATNCSGTNKLAAIRRRLDGAGFTYWGDSRADLPLWQAADEACVVAPSNGLWKAVQKVSPRAKVAGRQHARFKPFVSALRPHQWSKNLLLFLPLFLAHQWYDLGKLWLALVAMAAFSAAASAIYIVNDLLDIESDRRHPTKCRRPFAAGELSIPAGLCLSACGAMTSFVLAITCLAPSFTAWLALYLLTTTAYSLSLKKRVVIDVILLAGLYTLRIAAGAAAVSVPVSPWLLAFAMFFFLSLALGKRYIELRRTGGAAESVLPGRGYCADDAQLLEQIGPTSGYLAVLVFCLYIDSGAVEHFYRHAELLWLVCPLLLYWITRFWLLARRRQINYDPVAFALKDRTSLAVIAATATTVLLAAN
jgi:4-hydroxybenzoate polyprenyltransferase